MAFTNQTINPQQPFTLFPSCHSERGEESSHSNKTIRPAKGRDSSLALGMTDEGLSDPIAEADAADSFGARPANRPIRLERQQAATG